MASHPLGIPLSKPSSQTPAVANEIAKKHNNAQFNFLIILLFVLYTNKELVFEHFLICFILKVEVQLHTELISSLNLPVWHVYI